MEAGSNSLARNRGPGLQTDIRTYALYYSTINARVRTYVCAEDAANIPTELHI